MLITSELGEALEAMRHGKFCSKSCRNKMLGDFDYEKFENQYTDDFKEIFEMEVKDSFEDEIADAFIRLGDLCQKFDIDIEKHILLKQRYNESRDKLHGKKF
jgi:NTP pyrophosphatase (non-canonical NTP hydrolase)